MAVSRSTTLEQDAQKADSLSFCMGINLNKKMCGGDVIANW